MPRPLKRTRPCGVSCGTTRARPIRSFWPDSRRRLASPPRRGPTWRGSIGSARRKGATRTGDIRHDPDARITKMKDGRTHLAHKAEHAVVGVTVQGADQGDTTTIAETVTTAAEELEGVAAVTDGQTRVIEELVADKGYHSNQTLVRSGAARRADLHRRTEPGPASMEEQGRGPAPRSTPTGGGSAADGGAPCSGAAASDWNDRMRISMTPAGCAGRICAATTTSSNDCWSTRVASTWAFSCRRWAVWARREGSRGGLRPSWPSSWRSGRSHTPCGVTEMTPSADKPSSLVPSHRFEPWPVAALETPF